MDPMAADHEMLLNDDNLAFPSSTIFDQDIASWFEGAPIESSISQPSQVTPYHDQSTRVCNRCIQKKVKCDLKRPSCSRCRETSSSCVYSTAKRKPGPSRGRRQNEDPNRHRISHGPSPSQQLQLQFGPEPTQGDWQNSPQPGDSATTAQEIDHISGFQVPNFENFRLPIDDSSYLMPTLRADQERQLVDNFLRHIHPSFPLFRKSKFLKQYEEGAVSRSLLNVVLAVSAKVLGPISFWDSTSLENYLARLLARDLFDEEPSNGSISLDQFERACLLAFYAFHQFPDEKAWMRIGDLTRKAHRYRLHQLDGQTMHTPTNPRLCLMEEDLDEWRCVWWCIFCLDSYSNITAETPFVIHIDSITTALPMNLDGSSLVASTKLIFLPPEQDMLWETAKEVAAPGGDINFNVHIITTAILREASHISRIFRSNGSKRLQSRLLVLEETIAAVKLALPAQYLIVSRNVLNDETSTQHHGRLVCMLHLHMSRLLLSFPPYPGTSEVEWHNRWQKTLQHCQDIGAIIKEWDGQFSSTTDPAICFIIFASLGVLHIHRKFRWPATHQRSASRLDSDITVLFLFLNQFSSLWDLPNILKTHLQVLIDRIPENIEWHQVEKIMQHWQRFFLADLPILGSSPLSDSSTLFSP